MKAKVALVALLVAAHANIAHAASLPVVIEKLNEAAKTCGLSESQLESLALRTLESSQLQPDTNADGWLHVHVTVNQARRDRCAAHIAVQMKASAKPLPRAGLQIPSSVHAFRMSCFAMRAATIQRRKPHFRWKSNRQWSNTSSNASAR